MTRDEFVSKFKVGDKVRIEHWNDGVWVEILFIGHKKFFSKDNQGDECSWGFNEREWVPYTEQQKPKKTVKLMSQAIWQSISGGGIIITGTLFSSKEEASTHDYYKLIQWPLVINEVEQWIEVEVEE